jgi:hypothetical protein
MVSHSYRSQNGTRVPNLDTPTRPQRPPGKLRNSQVTVPVLRRVSLTVVARACSSFALGRGTDGARRPDKETAIDHSAAGRRGSHCAGLGPNQYGTRTGRVEQKFEPDGTVDPAEVEKRVRHLKSLYYSRITLKMWKK